MIERTSVEEHSSTNKDFEGERWISGVLWYFSLPCTGVQLLVCFALCANFECIKYVQYDECTLQCVTDYIIPL